MKRKEIKWRREGRGTMAGRQDGIIFRIFRPWDAPERGHTVSCYDTKETGRTISTAGYREFTWEEAVEFCQKIAAGEIDLEDLQAQFDAEDMAKEREAVRKTTEKAKRLAAMLERYGMKYTDLLELEVMRQALGEMGQGPRLFLHLHGAPSPLHRNQGRGNRKNGEPGGLQPGPAGSPGSRNGGAVRDGGGATEAGKGWRQWRTFSRYLIGNTR